VDNSFGNFRALLKAMTLTPGMGLYLNMQGNDKGSIVSGLHANENFAREIQQLFSIGLFRMWADGTLILDSKDDLVPTYDQNVVEGFAKVFTGWNYFQANQGNGRLPSNWFPGQNYTNPMVLVPTHHDLGTKLLLDNVVLPQAWGNATVSSTTTNDNYCLQDFESAMDSIYNNQNVGPFVCRQLIQRLVTSNPSRDYLYRVVKQFNDNGNGVRGDMQAVVRAILLDTEARSTNSRAVPTFGGPPSFLAQSFDATGTLLVGTPLGVFRSTDGGRTWHTTARHVWGALAAGFTQASTIVSRGQLLERGSQPAHREHHRVHARVVGRHQTLDALHQIRRTVRRAGLQPPWVEPRDPICHEMRGLATTEPHAHCGAGDDARAAQDERKRAHGVPVLSSTEAGCTVPRAR